MVPVSLKTAESEAGAQRLGPVRRSASGRLLLLGLRWPVGGPLGSGEDPLEDPCDPGWDGMKMGKT